MSRFEIMHEERGNCGDNYCTGHRESFLIDNKRGKELRIHPAEDFRYIVEVLNWLYKECDNEE